MTGTPNCPTTPPTTTGNPPGGSQAGPGPSSSRARRATARRARRAGLPETGASAGSLLTALFGLLLLAGGAMVAGRARAKA